MTKQFDKNKVNGIALGGLLILIIAAAIFAGCAGQPSQEKAKPSEGTPTQTQTPAPSGVTLTTAGGTPGGVGYAIMSATMSTTSKNYPEINYNIVPGGWVGNIHRVNRGELDVAHTTKAAGELAILQKGPFEGKPKPENVRTLFMDQIEVYYFIVARADFPYDTIDEVVAAKYPLKVTNQPKGTFGGYLWDSILTELGMDEETLKSLGGSLTRVTWSDAASLLRDGHVDAILAVGGKKIGWLEEITALKDVKYVGLSEELADKVSEKYGLIKVEIPAGTFPKQDKPIIALKDTGMIIAKKDLPDDVAFKIVKSVATDYEYFKSQHAMLQNFEPGPGMYKLSPFPIHPGAEEAYKELGYMK